MKNLYLFRHGQSTWNIERRCQGQKRDVPISLSEKGLLDAKTIAPKLKDKKITLVISSDLLRAKQTAEIVSKDLNVPVQYDERLRETNFGKAQGLVDEEVEKQFPDFIDALRFNHDQALAETGESINQVKTRMRQFLKEIALNPEKNIAISAHGSIIGNFLSTIGNNEFVKLKNGGVAHIVYDSKKDTFVYKGIVQEPIDLNKLQKSMQQNEI